MSKDTLLEFPCHFSIKVFGSRDTDFEDIVLQLVQPHVAELERSDLSHKLSSGGRYVAVTVHIIAQSQAQLDAIYQDLSDHSAVLMTL